MTRRPTLMFGVVLLFCSWPTTLPLLAQAPANANTSARAAACVKWGDIPLSFEPNMGQESPQVRYLARGSTYTLYLASAEMLLSGHNQPPLRMKLLGANPAPDIVGESQQVSTTNYLIGNEPSKWRTSVPNYGRARYRSVYPGIDLVYYGHDGNLEYDWIVSPSADPRRIRLRFDSADRLRVDKQGELVVEIGQTAYRQKQPVVYQDIGGKRIEIAGRWRLHGKEAGFRIGDYDRSQPLIIDPVLYYSTYLGGSSNDYAYAVAVDGFGNTYVTGGTGSANFPTSSPVQPNLQGSVDVFVTKINASGSARLYSTFLGSGGVDEGKGIAVNSGGEVYVTGSAGFSDFPMKDAIQPTWGGSGDAFLTKLNAAGSGLVYSTYLGGNAVDYGTGIALDAAGDAYVVGVTFSTNFPTVAPFQGAKGAQQDAFVAKINAAGSAWVYATYLGGDNVDEGYGIAVDATGNAYVTGYTASTSFAMQSPFQGANAGSVDAFITKLNPAGSALVYSTYLGGSGTDYGTAIAVDSSGSAYVTGIVTSDDFPLANPIDTTLGSHAVDDVFITKFTPSGSGLVYSTYLGGASGDDAYAIALDRAGNAYITGRTNSSDFPLVNPIQGTRVAFDVFVTEVNAAGSALVFSTFIGGSGSESGRGIAVDSVGNIHIAGESTSTDFPTVNPVQTANGGVQDAIVLQLGNAVVPTVTVSLNRKALVFGATTTGSAFASQTGPQLIALTQTAGPAVSWTATSNKPWLVVTPSSGSGAATLNISVAFDSSVAAAGNAAGSVTVVLTGAANTVGPIGATLTTVAATAAPSIPFGSFDTPAGDGTVLDGSIGVTGWTLDNIGVKSLELWRDLQPGETTPPFAGTPTDPRNGKVFIANAPFVAGARPDVEALYPSTPLAYRAGWGYLLLTWGLSNQGNGTYKLYAFAFDQENNVATIGSKSIVVNNNAAVKPFGSIDTPAIGGDPGTIPNFGWGLTPKVNGVATCRIPSSGVQVSIDSGPVQPVVYGDARADIAGGFPGFSNTAAAGGHFVFNWSTLANGPHTIGWLLTDDCSRAAGVGSRFFTVTTGTSLVAAPTETIAPFTGQRSAETESNEPILVARGYGELPEVLDPGTAGARIVELKAGDRVELRLPRGFRDAYQVVAGQVRGLPTGSTWDADSGTFYWQPAPGFFGRYRLVFSNGRERVSVRLFITP